MAEYIEREALIREIISNMASFIGTPDEVQKHDEQCNYAISCIEDALSVDVVEAVHGRWTMNSDRPDTIICSNCHVSFDVWKADINRHNFCPYCGAKMDGGNSDE